MSHAEHEEKQPPSRRMLISVFMGAPILAGLIVSPLILSNHGNKEPVKHPTENKMEFAAAAKNYKVMPNEIVIKADGTAILPLLIQRNCE